MKRFNEVCGGLMAAMFLAAMAFAYREYESGKMACIQVFVAVLVAWLAGRAAAMFFGFGRLAVRGIARVGAAGAISVAKGNAAGGRTPLPIDRLAQAAGFVVVSKEADKQRVRANDGRSAVYIDVGNSGEFKNVLFQSWFSVRFSLEREPQGLFGRVLIRNLDVCWSKWAISLGGSCEACLTLSASVPPAALDARLFADICNEITDEMNAFHRELHEKFRYSAEPLGMPDPPPRMPTRDNGGGRLPYQIGDGEKQPWAIR